MMQKALDLAQNGQGWVLPNPMVGAILLKDGKIIGEGFHENFGSEHAEINALKNVKTDPKGSILYVTLEPCCHHGKTPPCTDAIIKAGIKQVYIACKDPSEKVSGNGIQILKNAGLKVEVGVLENKAKNLNKEFFTFHLKNRPFISLKTALTFDGKISKTSLAPTQITGKVSQKKLHELRHNHQAILVGAGTIRTDNPHLGVRAIEGRQPLRVILKGKEELNLNSRVFRDDNFLILDQLNPTEIVNELYKHGILSVLIEGGNKIYSSFIKSKLIDEVQCFMAPQLLGRNALSFAHINAPLFLSIQSVQQLEQDFLVTATPQWDSNNG